MTRRVMFACDARAESPVARTGRAQRRVFQIVLIVLCASWMRREFSRERAAESDVGLQRKKSRWFIEPCIGDRIEASTSDDSKTILFVTFAFTRNAGGRWSVESTKTALRLMYSSLARSQATKPRLHVYTDTPDVIPLETTFGTEVDVITHACDAHSFPANAYTKVGSWAALSRAKLDAVDYLMTMFGARVIWIDLDTLVFVDLAQTFRQSSSWVVGYQRGANCSGLRACFRSMYSKVRPEFDALGDLWSLDRETVTKVREFERRRILSNARKPPKYDLQTYYGQMLEEETLSSDGLLHKLFPNYNFGFFCSNFMHPTVENLKLSIDEEGNLICPRLPNVKMGERVGAISFTAKTFQSTFSVDGDAFEVISHPGARRWLRDWFYGPIATGSNVTAGVGVEENVHPNPKTHHARMIFTLMKKPSAGYDDADIVSVRRWYGRLGNRVRTLAMMLENALVHGCHVRILDNMLPGWKSESTFFANRQVDVLRNKHPRRCRKLSGRRWYEMYLKSHYKGALRQQNGFADDGVAIPDDSTVTAVISRYFETNATHAFGRACESVGDDVLAVHVRAGDIVSGYYSHWTGNFVAKHPSKHTTYGPFPTSYYASVQRYASESGSQVRVFCEDLNNPTCIFFQQLAAMFPNVTMRVGQDLISDLVEFNCASRVAFSFGSFRDAIILRNRPLQTHDFFFDRNEAETTCSRTSSGSGARHRRYFFAFKSDEEEYKKSIRRNNWRNTALQRHLVDKHYRIGFIECENRGEDVFG